MRNGADHHVLSLAGMHVGATFFSSSSFSTSSIFTSAFLSAVGEEGRPSSWLKEGIFSSLFNVVIFRLCADSNGDSRIFNNRGAAGLSLFFWG